MTAIADVQNLTFVDFLDNAEINRGLGSEDVVIAFAPLLEQVAAMHENGFVADLAGLSRVGYSQGELWLPAEAAISPKSNFSAILRNARREGRVAVTQNIAVRSGGGTFQVEDKFISSKGAEKPENEKVYLPGYEAWETTLGHHDALSDIFVLGLALGSACLNLDLIDREKLAEFVQSRHSLTQANSRLHPVVARIIRDMTELDREARPQDLRQVAITLRNYRTQTIPEEAEAAGTLRLSPRQTILTRLRNRLFENSKRNRLVYFQETQATINLSVASTPRVIDPSLLKPSQILHFDQRAAKAFQAPVDLNNWLQFEDYPYTAVALDRVRLDMQNSEREYGMSQLRLVIAFLRWTNLKEAPDQRMNSPLILVPARITRRKGVKDSFRLECNLAEAEINPALRTMLLQLYNLKLPESIDATSYDNVVALHTNLVKQLDLIGRGVRLALVDVPRIRLIHRAATRKLEEYLRRARRGATASKTKDGFVYSYRRGSVEPLGVQLFEQVVRASRAPNAGLLQGLAASNAAPENHAESSEPKAGKPVADEIARDYYQVDQGERAGPYEWEFDLCSLTLANFNYRKMTLVRDYVDLIGDKERSAHNFDRLFSGEARPVLGALPTRLDISRLVLPADPSQIDAVSRAVAGDSFVIQGPPGSGKSQTITNMIAGFVDAGKSVLFVCEKRAALDVVFHRLRQCGLGDLVALVHDSQMDKRAFIDELKQRYDGWVAKSPDRKSRDKRDRLHGEIQRAQEQFQRAQRFMATEVSASSLPPTTAGDLDVSLRALLELKIAHTGTVKDSAALNASSLPGWRQWCMARDAVSAIESDLRIAGYAGGLGRSPFRYLPASRLLAPDMSRQIGRLKDELEIAEGYIRAIAGTFGQTITMAQMAAAARFAITVLPAMEAGNSAIFDPYGAAFRKFLDHSTKINRLENAALKAATLAANWRDDVPVEDVAAHLAVAEQWHGRFLRFVVPGWRRANRFATQYCVRSDQDVRDALRLLQAKLHAAALEQDAKARFEQEFGFAFAPELFVLVDGITKSTEATENVTLEMAMRIADGRMPVREMVKLAQPARSFMAAYDLCTRMLSGYEDETPDRVLEAIRELAGLEMLPVELAETLAVLERDHERVLACLRANPYPSTALEPLLLNSLISQRLRRSREAENVKGDVLTGVTQEALARLADIRGLNGITAVDAAHQAFADDIVRSNEMGGDGKIWARDFRRGRKALENEFQKTRAFKSIREIFSSEMGDVLRRLKPVWLMSPLSVADILPLDEKTFDVVVFDEASQIPLEDAIPAASRASQIIVVGDEMQLPPTSFFSGGSSVEEDDEEEAGLYTISGESFLDHATAALPGTLLSWHYRSRDEVLIDFCNAAFYKGKLQTVPNRQQLERGEAVTVTKIEDGDDLAQDALKRPLSFHKMQRAPYGAQRNQQEARYIARLLRALLLQNTGKSIGIVAFSQAQQSEIEASVRALAETDTDFRARLDEEDEREADGHFVGLFIKNLENVQGDERDIIILSVCYGPDERGRMLMNFGPINQNGGARRLNVVFSRAKHHMIVVSSIRAEQITNVYNEGANALRQYLAYAEAAALGNFAGTEAAIQHYKRAERQGLPQPDWHAAADQIAAAMQSRGAILEVHWGRSALKCHIALRLPGDDHFTVGVFIDDRQIYETNYLDEYHLICPAIMESYGWKTMLVLARDWFEDPNAVTHRIMDALLASRSDAGSTSSDVPEPMEM